MRSWQMQEAKARLSDVLRDAQTSGPQEITLRGKPAAIVLSTTDYEKLRGKKPSIVEFFRASPLVGVELDLERDKSPMRDIDL